MPTRSGELSTGEVAERLGLRIETVPNIIRWGRLPA
jgi:DNA-binding CsgD family transcriptional regulator